MRPAGPARTVGERQRDSQDPGVGWRGRDRDWRRPSSGWWKEGLGAAMPYSFTGTVDTVDAFLVGTFAVGDTLHGTFEFDPLPRPGGCRESSPAMLSIFIAASALTSRRPHTMRTRSPLTSHRSSAGGSGRSLPGKKSNLPPGSTLARIAREHADPCGSRKSGCSAFRPSSGRTASSPQVNRDPLQGPALPPGNGDRVIMANWIPPFHVRLPQHSLTAAGRHLHPSVLDLGPLVTAHLDRTAAWSFLWRRRTGR